MSNLCIRLLGPFQVEIAGKPAVGFASDKVRALLAYLATEADQPHRRDNLAGLLWPNSPQKTARTNLRRALANLRKTIGDHQASPPYLFITRQTIQFNSASHAWVDAEEFAELATTQTEIKTYSEQFVQSLEKAAKLYKGSFLEGFFLEDGILFEEWTLLKRERFQRQAEILLHHLATYYEEHNAYEQALHHAWRQVELDPLQESAQRQVMRLLTFAGQRAAALSQFEYFKRLLAEELNVAPEAKTLQLQQQIQEELLAARTISSQPPLKIPLQATPFIGRQVELKILDSLITKPDVRLITIVGPGGMGKTRLAIKMAEYQHKATIKFSPNDEWRFPDGVYFVHLSGVHEIDQIIPTIAETVDLPFQEDEHDGRDLDKQLFDFVHHRRILLVIDNFEQLLAGANKLAEILQHAPDVKVIVTSREKLRLHEEQIYSVQGLKYFKETPEKNETCDAELLFLQSARRAQPDFMLGQEENETLASICRRVEGMPLAIELAATWVDTLSLSDLDTEIQRGLDCLETKWRNMPARHQSVRATFDVSWQRLRRVEQDAFVRLSVFQGGFTRVAAQEGVDVSMQTLAVLVGKSLLSFNQAHNRYEVHELLRQYGAEKLAQGQEQKTAVYDQHATFYCAMLAEKARYLRRPHPQWQVANNLISADIENIRSAWKWAVDRPHITNLKQALDGLCQFYEGRNFYQEGVNVCKIVMQAIQASSSNTTPSDLQCDAQDVLGRALAWQGSFYRCLGQNEIAHHCLQKSMELYACRPLADQDTCAHRAFVHLKMGHYFFTLDNEKMLAHYEQSLDLARTADDATAIAEALWALGIRTDNLLKGKQNLEECLVLAQSLDNSWQVVDVLNELGWIQQQLLNYDEAQKLYNDSFILAQVKEYQKGVANALESQGILALFQGHFDIAIDQLRQSLSINRQIGQPLDVAASLMPLSHALRLSGEFSESLSLAEEGVKIYREIGYSDVTSRGIRYLAAINLDKGYYDVAYDLAQSTLTLSQVGTGWSWRILGWVALVKGKKREAYQLFQKSAGFYREIVKWDRKSLAISLAALGRTAIGLGNQSEAKKYLMEALETAVTIRAFEPLFFIVPFLAVLLAEIGELDLATELYSLAIRQPYVGKSHLINDLIDQGAAGKSINFSLGKPLTYKGINQSQNLLDAMTRFLTELKKLGWYSHESN